MERRYTVAEIDQMREIIRCQYPIRWTVPGGGGDGVRDTSNDGIVESRLRTYMMAGIGPDELHEAFEAARKERAGDHLLHGRAG